MRENPKKMEETKGKREEGERKLSPPPEHPQETMEGFTRRWKVNL
jgi:hypothetical protein